MFRKGLRYTLRTALILFLVMVVFHVTAFVVAFWPFNDTIKLGPRDFFDNVYDCYKHNMIFTTRSDGDNIPNYNQKLKANQRQIEESQRKQKEQQAGH